MRKFILNTLVFVVPFFGLYVFNLFNYSQRGAEGDLARMGYFYANPSPRSVIDSQHVIPKEYLLLSEVGFASNQKFDVMTIGDSFTEQDNLGYKNYLAATGASVLHVDRFISGSNPIQTLVSLMNSGFFDLIQPEFVVLQSIERDLNDRTQTIDFDERLDLAILSNEVKQHKRATPNYDLQFFSDATLKMPLNNFQFSYTDKPIFSNTHQVKTNRTDLFSNSPDKLLFYKSDLRKMGAKNDSLKTLNSVKVLGELSALLSNINIELIVLISPDKYDLYYPYIADKSSFGTPTFFATYDKAPKAYYNVDAYRVFSEKMGVEKDIYYYDDTHWSPVGGKIVVDEILEIMKK
jgi:hypothetical protein